MDSSVKRQFGVLALGSALLLAGCGEPENQQVTTVGPDGDRGYELEDLEGEDFSQLAGNPLTADVTNQDQPQTGGQPGLAQQAETGNQAAAAQAGATGATDSGTGQADAGAQAIAVMSPVGDSGVRGTVLFSQQDGGILVEASLSGLSAGQQHGFHVHELGDCGGDNAANAGDHWNPAMNDHGAPDNDAAQRHVGDLGNVEANDQGAAEYRRIDQVLSFEGENGIIGKAVIVHAMQDDLMTQPGGDSGDPVACGVIEAGGSALSQDVQQPVIQQPDNV